jgi:hypothetical protein
MLRNRCYSSLLVPVNACSVSGKIVRESTEIEVMSRCGVVSSGGPRFVMWQHVRGVHNLIRIIGNGQCIIQNLDHQQSSTRRRTTATLPVQGRGLGN